MNDYSTTMMSRDELENLLKGMVDPLAANRIVSGYEISESIFTGILMKDGSPYFSHLTRVARIIILELNIFDPDLIIASLLHDFKKVESLISKDILEINFGPYLLYLVELLTMTIEETGQVPKEFHLETGDNIKIPIDDYLTIKLAEQVDYFRSLSFDLSRNPVAYLCDLNKRFLPVASQSKHPAVQYLLQEINILKNKIVG